MDNRPMAKATIDGIRAMSGRELATIRAALRLWRESAAVAIPIACYEELGGCLPALNDTEIETLILEIQNARKVTVCHYSA